MDVKQSSSGNEDNDQDEVEGEDEQVLHPKIKRKRSIRIRPKQEKPTILRGDSSSQLPFQADRKHVNVKTEIERETDPSLKTKRTPATKKNSNKANVNVPVRTTRGNSVSTPPNENLAAKVGTSIGGTKMSEAVQRRVRTAFHTLCYQFFILFYRANFAAGFSFIWVAV